VDFGLRYWKQAIYNAHKVIAHEVRNFSLLWQVIENMENNYHFPSFGPNDNFFP